MRVLVSGAGGLVGESLCRALIEEGHGVQRLVRRAPSAPDEVQWDPQRGLSDPGSVRADAVVHLAGESIAEGRWSAAKKQRIRDSRVQGTRKLCESLVECAESPKVIVCASAIGFYGHRGESKLNEDAAAGAGFLPNTCVEWEAACEPARAAGARVVNLRIGVVLSKDGGALAKMLLPFKLGLGGKIGDGSQYMSWITLSDLVQAIQRSLGDDALEGPVNAVAPGAVTNLEFTKALGRALGRPTVFPLPAFMAKLALGEMAEDLLLASIRVTPSRLTESGFRFTHPELNAALAAVLKGDDGR